MDAYTGFAALYDLFMDNIPYEKWGDYLKSLLTQNGIKDGILLDIGCGTGNITQYLAKSGYDMIGIDNSDEMLSIAMEKREQSHLDILYLLQDMREFELYGTVAAAVSICDSLNYILEYDELVKVFKLVNNYLDPNGIFIFDLNTVAKYIAMDDETIAENREEGSFIWENSYFSEENINQYDLSIFEKLDNGFYAKHEETHLQRAYTISEIKSALKEANLEFLNVYDAFTFNPPQDNSERIYVIARETTKLKSLQNRG